MKSKIIKISVILLFILFSMGFFNFCFAIEFNRNSYDIKYTINGSSDYNIGIYSVQFDRLTKDNSINHNTEFKTFKVEDINGYSKIYGINFKLNKLYCLILPDGITTLHLTSNDGNGLLYCGVNGFSYYIYEYNFDTKIWDYVSRTSRPQVTIGSYSYGICDFISFDNEVKIYDSQDIFTANVLFDSNNFVDSKPSIEMNTVQTGTSTGYVEFTSKNWDSPHMYYIKDSMDELVRLIAEEELSTIHPKVKHYDGPIDININEYVLGLLFDSDGTLVFSEISDGITLNYDSLTDTTHKLYLDKENEDIYYLSIHGYQDGDYVEVSTYPYSSDSYSTHKQVIGDTLDYNGLQIGQLYNTALGHKNRKIKLSKNGITYFNLFDKDGNFINTCVLNSSNYYSGEDFDFDVELSYGSSPELGDGLHLSDDEIRWVKVKPIVKVSSLSNYELFLKISDYGNIPYIDEEDRIIYATHDSSGSKYIGIDLGSNSNGEWHRIDDKILNYFYINTGKNNCNFTFELQLRSKVGQVLQTKSFNVNTSNKSDIAGTVSSSTDGKNDTFVRNPNELSNDSLNSGDYNFNGLYSLNQEQLTNNVNDIINNSKGFFSILSTLFLLLPTWISALIFLFFTGLIAITLLRFLRGA